jgi:outer membrane protein assembly factor BamB
VTELAAYGSDGVKRWEIPAGSAGAAQWNPIAPAIGPDGSIYAVSGDSENPNLMGVAPTGRMLWIAPLSGRARELIAGPDGRIVVAVPMGHVLAFDSGGHELWRFYSGNRNNDGGIALGPDGTLYFASSFLHALSAEGKQRWAFKSELTYTRGDYFDKHPVIAEDGTIYAVSCYQQLYAVTPNGRKKWHLSGDPRDIRHCWDQIILTAEGTLIATEGRMRVSSGLAKDGWPSQNRDNGNRRSQEVP